MLKKTPAAFSFAQKLNVPKRAPSPLRSLRPCWTAILSILLSTFPTALNMMALNSHCPTTVFPYPLEGKGQLKRLQGALSGRHCRVGRTC